jgi:predicted nicotinamide N-methyase
MISHPLKIVEVKVGKRIVKIAIVQDPLYLFDELLSKDPEHADVKDERIPYWSELWPSSIAMAEYLEENPFLVKDKQVLEIGCGLGLPGVVAGALGGKVILTDYLNEALDFATYNWKLNNPNPADTRLLDWRSPVAIEPADVLLASDVAYESRSFLPLVKAISQLVKKDGTIIIAEPNRKFAKEFFLSIKQAGYNVQEEIREVIKDNIRNIIFILFAYIEL